MNRLSYSIDIKADKPNIWKALWNEANYRKWAAVFFKGSYIRVNNWEEGSIIHFLGEGQNGIYSLIDSHDPDNSIRFKHIGNVSEGEEQEPDKDVKLWSGATESYSIRTNTAGGHSLTIEIDVMDEHLDFMKEKLPLALDVIKEMAV